MEWSIHMQMKHPNTMTVASWRWFYNSRIVWEHQVAPWRTFKEMEMHRTRYFRTARNTKHNPGHQSPEPNHHLERRWYLVGTGCPSCWTCYRTARRWPTWCKGHYTTCKRSGWKPQGLSGIFEWWRSNPVQISCNACRLFGTGSSWSTSCNAITCTRTSETNH